MSTQRRARILTALATFAAVFAFFASLVSTASASSWYRVNRGSSTAINEWGTCYVISNAGSYDTFVPTNTSAEWSGFYSHLPPNVSKSSCVYGCTDPNATNYNPNANINDGSCSYCASNQGNTCTASDSCGTNYGTIQCNGSCSVSSGPAPSNYGQTCSASDSCGTNYGTIQCNGSCSVSSGPAPSNYGQSCTSSANACGQTNTGTIQCNGTCSASTPSNPANYGQSCTSSANACGQTNTGTIQCNGTCSASTPSNPANYGQSCSVSNSCGQTNYGTIQCNGSCSATMPACAGCTDPNASNYNPNATVNNNSCTYTEYCFTVSADIIDSNYADPMNACQLQYFDYSPTITYDCGTSYSSCQSDQQSFLNTSQCADVGSMAPFWNSQVGSNPSGYPSNDCISWDYSYGNITGVGSIVPCTQAPSFQQC